MTSAGGGELSGIECCGGISVQSAITSLRQRITAARLRCIEWLSSCTTRLRDAIDRASENRRLGLEEGCCPTTAGRLVESVRPALGGCRRLIGRRLTEAFDGCRPGTARLRESMACCRAVLAEFVGTFFLVVIGCGSATEQSSYSPEQQQQQDRAIRIALAFGIVMTALFFEKREQLIKYEKRSMSEKSNYIQLTTLFMRNDG